VYKFKEGRKEGTWSANKRGDREEEKERRPKEREGRRKKKTERDEDRRGRI